MSPTSLIGPVYLISFAALSTSKDIALEHRLKTENPYDYLLLVFGFTAIVYLSIDKLDGKGITSKAFSGGRDFLLLNVATAGNWIGLFLSLKYLSAPVVAGLYAGTIPVCTLLVNRILRPGSAVILFDYLGTALLLFISISMAFSDAVSFRGLPAGLGLAFVVLSSFTIATTTVVSKRLADAGARATNIMAHRFYILIGVAVLMSSPLQVLIEVLVSDIELLLFVAAGGTIASLWLLQKGIEKCEPVLAEVILATTPIVSVICYSLTMGINRVSSVTVSLAILIVIVAIVHIVLHFRALQTK